MDLFTARPPEAVPTNHFCRDREARAPTICRNIDDAQRAFAAWGLWSKEAGA
jgi:hypothetical protein